jgi:lysophospholipase L1-like esterase
MKSSKINCFVISVLLFFCQLGTPAAAGPGQVSPGPSDLPFDELARVYRAIESRMSPLSLEFSSLPVVKKDRRGRTWAAWEEWESGQSRVRFGMTDGGRPVAPQAFGRPGEENFSPDFSFDQSDSPWVVWISYYNRKCRILLRECASRRTWALTPAASPTLTDPRIVFDADNRAWVFWNQTESQKGEICYRTLDRLGWSPLRRMPQESSYPALNPDVALDREGKIVVVWSRYDGEDYEIYLSRWDGRLWQRQTPLSDNNKHDNAPAVVVSAEGPVVISWTRSTEGGSKVCYKFLEAGALSGEFTAASPSGRLTCLKIIREGENIGAVWKSPAGIHIEQLRLEPPAPASSRSPLSPADLLYDPSRDDARYICFGDSITYGYMDRLPTPEAGYPLRLDAILKQNFGSGLAINEGIGGENTTEGLGRIDSVLSTHPARYILIMEGTNDVISLHTPIDTIVFNLREMTAKCLKRGVLPILATIIPRQDFLYSTTRIIRDRHHALVEEIREIPGTFPVPFVDQYKVFMDYPEAEGGLRSLLSGDLKHPSEKGYQVMAEAWFDEIKNLPFPPVSLRLTARDPEPPFAGAPRSASRPRPARRGLFLSRESKGNILTWSANPKILDRARILGYKIYRMRRDIPSSRFRLIATVQGPLSFFDESVRLPGDYFYVISTVRDDGVEGPCSEVIGN